jgi:glycosyltransferase involved in cell wall biosynthesis
MKILYLHQYFNTPDMPGGTRSYEMARRFVRQGHEVHMITSWREPRDDHAWFESNEAGIHVHWLPVEYTNKMLFSNRIKAFLKFAIKSANKAASIKADIIFATSTPLTIALPAVYAAKIQKIPMVFEVRDLWPELPIAMGVLKNPLTRFLAMRLELFAYKNAQAINALSPGMKDGVIKTGFPSSNVSVIPNSSDSTMFNVSSDLGKDFRRARSWLGGDPLLLYTGTFGLINDVSYLVDLAIELRKINSDIKILAIGGGIEFQKVKDYAENTKVLNKIFFMEDYLKKREIPSALSAATISTALFLDKPEMRPNSANKFFDSMAAGRPIMINYGGWMHELVQSYGCGLAMWELSLSEVAKELDEKVYDNEWLKKASKASSLLAEERFDRDVLAGQLLEVIECTFQGHPDKSEMIAPGIY